MSTLEKATKLLQKLPEEKLEAVYIYMRFVDSQMETATPAKEKALAASAFGIAHKYANPELIQQEEGAFERAMVEKHALN